MIDLTVDDEEKAGDDAHAAFDDEHTELSSNATSSQRGMVMKIEVENAAGQQTQTCYASERACSNHADTRGGRG